jgi:acyl-CoA synthetase (AMP-forming)/AMP-acid ligase II
MGSLLNVGELVSVNAALYPTRIGARDLTREMTFLQWNERACRLANALMGLGLAKGDRVGVLAYNCVEWMEIYTAFAKAGLIAVPINFRLVGPEIAYIANNAGIGALIVQHDLIDQVESVRADLPVRAGCYIHFGAAQAPAGYRSYEALLAAASASEPTVDVLPSDPWTLMYTSGTMGSRWSWGLHVMTLGCL